MNMKRTAIIFLTLIFGLCIAAGAFAEEYMVVYIKVASGDIAAVYGADEVGSPAKEAKMAVKAASAHSKHGPHV